MVLGAVHATVTEPAPGVKVSPVGAFGGATGMAVMAAEALEVPTALLAVKVKL